MNTKKLLVADGIGIALNVDAFRESAGKTEESKAQAILALLSRLPKRYWRLNDGSPVVGLVASNTRPASPYAGAVYSPCSLQEAFNAIRAFCLADTYPVREVVGTRTFRGVTTDVVDLRFFFLSVDPVWAEEQGLTVNAETVRA